VYVISLAGELEIMKLGQELNDGRQIQGVVKAGSWFAAEVIDSNSFALAGCTVSPGFDFADFELASRQQLLNLFPQHETLISKFCRE
jgi:predicted cupin superfamily sugar epimerase